MTSPGLVCVEVTEADFRRHEAMRSAVNRDLRNHGVSLWWERVELWNVAEIPMIVRERDVRFHLHQARQAS